MKKNYFSIMNEKLDEGYKVIIKLAIILLSSPISLAKNAKAIS